MCDCDCGRSRFRNVFLDIGENMIYVIIKAGISAFLASLGFGFLFNIKGKNLWLAGVVGAVGGICYKVALYYGCSELLSNFYGALGLSLGSEILARQCKTPVTTFLVCALIPLVPGGGMYRTMLAAIRGNAQRTLNMGLETLSIAGVLALGILLVSTIMRVYYQEKYKYHEKRAKI